MPATRILAPLYRDCPVCLALGDACDKHWTVCACGRCLELMRRYRARLAALKAVAS